MSDETPSQAAIHSVSRKNLTEYQVMIFDKYFQRNFKALSTLEMIERISEEATADILPKLAEGEDALQTAKSLSDIFMWLLAFANHLLIDLDALLSQRYLYEGEPFCPLCGHQICICEFARLKATVSTEHRETVKETIERQTETFIEQWKTYQKKVHHSLDPLCLPPGSREVSLEFYVNSSHLLPLNPEKFSKIIKELIPFREYLFERCKDEERGSLWYWIDNFHRIYGEVNELKQNWEIVTKLVEDLGKLGENVRKLTKEGNLQEQRKIVCKPPDIFQEGRKERSYLGAIFKKLGSTFAWTAALLKKQKITPELFYHALIEEEINDYVYHYVRAINPQATIEEFTIPKSYPERDTSV